MAPHRPGLRTGEDSGHLGCWREGCCRGNGAFPASAFAARAAGCTGLRILESHPPHLVPRVRSGLEYAALAPFCLGHGIGEGFSKARGNGGACVEVSDAGCALGRRVFLAKTFPRRPLGLGPGAPHEANFSRLFPRWLREGEGCRSSPGPGAPLPQAAQLLAAVPAAALEALRAQGPAGTCVTAWLSSWSCLLLLEVAVMRGGVSRAACARESFGSWVPGTGWHRSLQLPRAVL